MKAFWGRRPRHRTADPARKHSIAKSAVVAAITGALLTAGSITAPAQQAATTSAPHEVSQVAVAPPAVLKEAKIVRTGATAPVRPQVAPALRTPTGLTWKQYRIYRSALAQVGWSQDCVALAARALRSVGIYYYVWPWQYYNIGYPVSYRNARAGDLVYYRNGGGGLAHIAVYIGNGRAVHGGWNGWTTVVQTVWVGSGPNFIRIR